MSRVKRPSSLEETQLWRRLDAGFTGQESKDAKRLAPYVLDVCEEARDRMNAFPALHPQYTLHDEAHLLGVTGLIATVMPLETLDRLNPVEIALLPSSARTERPWRSSSPKPSSGGSRSLRG